PLAESVVWRLTSGDATTFILAKLWEIHAREQEHKQWFPTPMEVYLLVCTYAHIQLNLLTSEVYGRFSISESVAYYVEKHRNTRDQNFTVHYFHMLLTQFPSYTIDFTKVYFFICILLIASKCTSLPTAEYIRLVFNRGKEIEPVERGSVFVRHISEFYLTSCLIAGNGLNFTDPCDGISAHGLILEFG
ncbi:hypothetical protein MKW92_008269, partial [Papaver armeniacum]